MICEVNDRDILPFLTKIRIKRNDLDGPNSGRTLDGTMYRDRVASKDTIECECKSLHSVAARDLLSIIKPEFVSVRYTSPELGERVGTFYCSNVSTGVCCIDDYGYEMWEGITFNLIER